MVDRGFWNPHLKIGVEILAAYKSSVFDENGLFMIRMLCIIDTGQLLVVLSDPFNCGHHDHHAIFSVLVN